MTLPTGASRRIWSKPGTSAATGGTAPAGTSAIIRASAGDCVPSGGSLTAGDSRIIRVPAAPCDWWWYGGHNQIICWPSEPRWGLLPYPAVGWPSGGSEVPRVLHGVPLYDAEQWDMSPCVNGTIEEWLPDALDYPWGPVGSGSDDYNLAVMIAQEGKSDLYISAYPYLTDGAGYSLSGDCWFGLYRNSILLASESAAATEATILYHGSMNAGDRFHLVYQTDVECPGGGQQGVAWSLWVP